MKDFKGIADDILKDVHVTASLKAKTLARCNKKSHISFTRYLVPAACLLLIIGVARFTGLFSENRTADLGNDTKINILMASPESTLERATAISIDPFEEARNQFGDGLLIPEYLPEGFIMGEIVAQKEDAGDIVSLHYASESDRFTITEHRTETPVIPAGMKEVKIKDRKGYLSSIDINGQTNPNTELYWYINGVQYSIAGSLTGQDALAIAESMK